METVEKPGLSTAITQPVQEKSVPEGNVIGNYQKLLYGLRLITHQSTIKGSEVLSQRPLSLRTSRAQLFKKFKSIPETDRETRKTVLQEAHERDEIARQYLTQGEVKVNIPELGEQSARYTVMNPPESRKTSDNKPPIFFIPGISNDIDCVGALTQEIAFMGRRVIVVGMPESIMGQITPEFAKAVSETSSFGPHTEFYKGAKNALAGKEAQVELWGHSTGGPIIAEMLSDPEFQEKTTDAVLLCPASSANISGIVLNLGLANELRNLAQRNLSKYTLSAVGDLPETPEHQELRGRVFKAMLKKVCNVAEGWKKSRVRAGGKIVVYSGRKDSMTRSYELFRGDQTSQEEIHNANPQVEVIDDPKGYHTTPLIEPQRVIREIFSRQAA